MVSFSSMVVQQVVEHPVHIIVELLFAASLAYLLLQRRSRRESAKQQKEKRVVNMPSLEEQERRLAAFHSAPFRSECKATSNVAVPEFNGMVEVQSRSGCHMRIAHRDTAEEENCLDLATYDYHSFSTNPQVVEVARATVNAYGVGSCGPRNFYGTVKPHLVVEEDLMKFLGTEDAIVYSYAYATVSTLISCFSARNDYLICDDGVGSAVMEGCLLSRSNLRTYKHCDMTELEEMLKKVVAEDHPTKPHRRFVVTEGVFFDSGDICPLPKIVELCRKYRFRLILEDSYGFGALGPTGRGTPEHFGMTAMDVDVYVGSLSTSMGAVGGFCAGASVMVDHQRLSAAAYCFSASLPPYITAAVSEVLSIMNRDTSHTVTLHARSQQIRQHLRKVNFNHEKLKLIDSFDDISPIIVLAVQPSYVEEEGQEEVENKLQRVVNAAQTKKVAIIRNVYTTEEPIKQIPGLRVVAKSLVSEVELSKALVELVGIIKAEFP